jgi:FkbM family methyltransferase
MKRPLLLRLTPDRFRTSVWSHLYRKKSEAWLPLYESATLRYAPLVSMELTPGDFVSDVIAFTGFHEIELTRRLVELARKGGTLVDIGANLGYFSLLWAALNPRNKCIAFEASPRNIDLLRRNVSRNRLEAQIEIVPHAAGRSPGKFQFDLGPAEQRGWGGLSLESGGRCTEVDVVRVDEVIRSTDSIALLKVDTEGADAWALEGCERLLKAGAVQEIWFEQNKPRSAALEIPPDAAQEYLRSVGYVSTTQDDPDGELVEWVAVRGQG